MEKRRKKTHTRTLGCGSACAKLVLAIALFIPALLAFRGVPETGKSSQNYRNRQDRRSGRKTPSQRAGQSLQHRQIPSSRYYRFRSLASFRSHPRRKLEAQPRSDAGPCGDRGGKPLSILGSLAGGRTRHHANHARHRQVLDRHSGPRASASSRSRSGQSPLTIRS